MTPNEYGELPNAKSASFHCTGVSAPLIFSTKAWRLDEGVGGAGKTESVELFSTVVSGLMVLARNGAAASELSRQIREDAFEKEYLAVVHGCTGESATLVDLLGRDKARRMTYVALEPGKGIQEAILFYTTISRDSDMSRVRIRLETGRTHQIRVQFASRGWPLVGERKYYEGNDPCEIALWSYRLAFCHPATGEKMEFVKEPPVEYPWNTV